MRDDGEPAFLSSAKMLASVMPSSTSVNIPINVILKPGLNYIWVSGLVKKEADIDKKVCQ